MTATTNIDEIERPMRPSLRKGWRRRCPKCGEGALFNGYLSVKDACANCGQAFHHHRADDGPAYLTIVIVGHYYMIIVVFIALGVAEELTVVQLMWNGRTVNPDEWAIAARRATVQLSGNKFLTGSALACDQHCGIGRSN